jgi:hypothetical protein
MRCRDMARDRLLRFTRTGLVDSHRGIVRIRDEFLGEHSRRGPAGVGRGISEEEEEGGGGGGGRGRGRGGWERHIAARIVMLTVEAGESMRWGAQIPCRAIAEVFDARNTNGDVQGKGGAEL